MSKLWAVLLLAPILFGLSLVAQAETLYVDDLTDGKLGRGSKIDPFRDLQATIDSAGDGDRLLLMPGTYEAHPDSYPEELCGNCEKHRTDVQATRGFLIKRKALEIVGSGIDSTILVTKAGYGVLFEHSRGSMITHLTITGGVLGRGQRDAVNARVLRHNTITLELLNGR